MRLNTSVLYERLKQKYPVIMYGKSSSEKILHAPELYMDNTLAFREGHVYLATVEHLPQRPLIEKHVVLICIGEGARLTYYKEHAVVLLIKKKTDFFEVYRSLQEIYELFQSWESRLLDLFVNSCTVQEVLEVSYPVFECPMYVLNASFQYVASIQPPKNVYQSGEALELRNFLDYLREKDLSMERKDAFLIEMREGNILCVNLFNSLNDYIGCLYIDQKDHSYTAGEEYFAQYLATVIQRIAENAPVLLKNENTSLREALKLLMNEMPLSQNQKILLKSRNRKRSYVCVSMHYLKRFSSFPVSYICSVLENLHSDQIFFEQDNTILGLIPLDGGEEWEKSVSSLAKEMQLCVGVSNEFADLYLLRTYYLQAEAAIENGQLYRPHQTWYNFSEFAVWEMIANSLGGFPVEAYFPKGFRKLLEHDQEGGISYQETLQVFLEENMSYARAARRLFIHRSTLIERISRIENELSLDFKDPEQRLQIQMVLKALSIEKRIQEK